MDHIRSIKVFEASVVADAHFVREALHFGILKGHLLIHANPVAVSAFHHEGPRRRHLRHLRIVGYTRQIKLQNFVLMVNMYEYGASVVVSFTIHSLKSPEQIESASRSSSGGTLRGVFPPYESP